MMENRTLIKGSIVLEPFPFDDFSFLEVRSALFLTSSIIKEDWENCRMMCCRIV